MGILENIADFLSKEAGQRRTQALNEGLAYYVPPELRQKLGLLAEITPTATAQRAGQAGERMLAPDRTAAQRVGDLGAMLSETAGVVAPAVVANRVAMPVAQAVQEGLLGFSMGADDIGRRFVERMNQPGPVPTMYSNPVMRQAKGAAIKPQIGEAFDDWIDRIYLPENRGPKNTVQDENVVFRAMSPGEAKAGEEAGVFRDLSGQPLYVANDPERYIGGGAYGGKRQGRIYEFDATGLASEVRQGGVGIQERAISEIPTDRVRRVWEWNPKTKAHELIVDNTQPQGLLGGPVAAPTGIKAYHGSPHDFDRFSMDKIGTGEGAQAYGHGLYFAEAEPVARGYRDALAGKALPSGDPVSNAWDMIHRLGGNDPKMRDEVRQSFVDMMQDADPKTAEFARKSVEAIDSGAVDAFKAPGRMYEVNIKANPEDFLDWDKPLREQPEVAKRIGYSDAAVIAAEKAKLYKAFQPPKGDTFEDLFAPLSAQEKAAAEKLAFMPEPWNEMTGKDAWNRAAQRRFSVMQDDGSWGPGAKTYEEALQMAGGDINKVRTLSDPSRQSRAEFMREAGIPGIKYFDAMSRGAGEGSRNYVVFDENLIEIVRKYGIAGAAALLGVSVMDVEQAVAQGSQPQPQGLLSGVQ